MNVQMTSRHINEISFAIYPYKNNISQKVNLAKSKSKYEYDIKNQPPEAFFKKRCS